MSHPQLPILDGQSRVGLDGHASGTITHHAPRPVSYPEPRLGRPAARPVKLPPISELPKAVIKTLVKRVHVTFLIDDSGSMYWHYGDPEGVRYAVALSIVDMLRRHGAKGNAPRATVIHWGTDAPHALAAGPLNLSDKKTKKQLDTALTIPPTLGGNDMARAFRAAKDRQRGDSGDTISLTFVLTDGIESVTQSTRDTLAALPAQSVHMLLIDRSHGCNEQMEADWRALPLGSFSRLNTWDTRSLATDVRTQVVAALYKAEHK